MTQSSRTVLWHAGSIAAGAWGMIVFAQSGHFDIYAFIEQLKKTWGDLVVLSAMAAPALAAGAAAYRTWGMKNVPHDSVVGPSNAVAIVPKDDVQPFGTGAMKEGVKGTVVAIGKAVAILLAAFLVFSADDNAGAQIFKLKTPAQITADIAAKVTQFEKITIDDLAAAKAIYDAAGNGNGSACAAAWIKLAEANAAAQAMPNPGVFSTLAKLYNVHVALQAGSPFRTACAAMKDDIMNSGAGILGGAAAVTKLVPVLAMFGL